MFTQLANKICPIHCNPYHCVPNRPVERVNRYTRPGKRLCLENLIIKNIYITSKRNNIGPTLAIVKVRSFLLRYVEKKYLERPRRSLPVLSITNRDNVNWTGNAFRTVKYGNFLVVMICKLKSGENVLTLIL